jgi:hypothetical protein
MLEGLPFELPVFSTGRLKKRQVWPLSSELQASMKCWEPSFCRNVVRIRVGDRRTDDGMMLKPFGSSPIQETKFQVLPPSVVRMHRVLPSRPFSFEAVMKAVKVFALSTK